LQTQNSHVASRTVLVRHKADVVHLPEIRKSGNSDAWRLESYAVLVHIAISWHYCSQQPSYKLIPPGFTTSRQVVSDESILNLLETFLQRMTSSAPNTEKPYLAWNVQGFSIHISQFWMRF